MRANGKFRVFRAGVVAVLSGAALHPVAVRGGKRQKKKLAVARLI